MSGMKAITIHIGTTIVRARLSDDPVAAALYEQMPFTVELTRWGDEYYGAPPVELDGSVFEGAEARELMEIGEIAYWQPGSAVCFFFGPTPASTDSRPRAVSPAIPIGVIEGDVSQLKALGPTVDAEFTP